MTSLNGDSYGGCGLAALTSVSSCQMFAGNGAGGTYTLAQLQAGAVSGINGSTRVAFWVGGTNTFSADVASITVNTSDVVTPTASVPEPATLTLLGFGLAGLAARLRRR